LATLGLGAVAIWGFIEGRAELAQETERERPVKAPQRISLEDGEPVITLDTEAQDQSGLQTVALQQTNYHEQLRAYATVLDLQPLVDLDNSYALAKAQLQGARAKLDASDAEFKREEKLFKTGTSIVTLDKLQAAEATFHTDEAALASAEAQLRTINETAEQTWGPVLGRQLGEENRHDLAQIGDLIEVDLAER
jgi:multidrug efflux pump subunit AcrA (membrane-fusion protein)